MKSGTRIGKISTALAKNLGFTKSVTVASGGHDMVCAAVGAGLDERSSETAVDIAGTIEGIVAAMGEANTSQTMLDNLLPCYPGFDGYVTFSVNLTAGLYHPMVPRCDREGYLRSVHGKRRKLLCEYAR